MTEENQRWLYESRKLIQGRLFSKDFKSERQLKREREQKMIELTYMINLPERDGTVGLTGEPGINLADGT